MGTETPVDDHTDEDIDDPEENDLSKQSNRSTPSIDGQPTKNEVAEPATEASELAHDEVYCTSCGEPVKQQAEVCPHCGVRQQFDQPGTPGVSQGAVNNTVGQKDPGIAALASALFFGGGQIYNGQIGKGLMFMFAGFISALLIFVAVGIVTTPLIWGYGIYDANKTAKKINAGQVV